MLRLSFILFFILFLMVRVVIICSCDKFICKAEVCCFFVNTMTQLDLELAVFEFVNILTHVHIDDDIVTLVASTE